MMVRTNLVWEILERERPTPWRVHLVPWSLVLAFAAIAWWSIQYRALENRRREFAIVHAKERAIAKDVEAARVRAAERATKMALRNAVVGFARRRLNWAPMLERLLAAVPARVEISSIHASCPSQKDWDIRIAGSAAAESPLMESEKFRVGLLDSFQDLADPPRFEKLEMSDRLLHLDGTDAPVADYVITVARKEMTDED